MFIVSKLRNNSILNISNVSMITAGVKSIHFDGYDQNMPPVCVWKYEKEEDVEIDWRYICAMVGKFNEEVYNIG